MNNDIWLSVYKYLEDTNIIIKNGNNRSDPIKTTIGCKQGGPMSPKLFSIYIDSLVKKVIDNKLTCKLFGIDTGILLYADDTVVICDSLNKLQSTVTLIQQFCWEHEISINIKKTKCMIIGPKKVKQSCQPIKIDNQNLDFVSKFKYLGIWLEDNWQHKEYIKIRKMNCMGSSYQLQKLGFNERLVDIGLKSFMYTVYCRTILFYGLEALHLTQKDIIEIQTTEGKIIKRSLNLNKFSSNEKIFHALNMKKTDMAILKRKLTFAIQLIENDMTGQIIAEQLNNHTSLSTKSLLYNILIRLGIADDKHDVTSFKSLLKTKIYLLEQDNFVQKATAEIQSIKYFLENRTFINDLMLKEYTNKITT
jgi:hypothetical protein